MISTRVLIKGDFNKAFGTITSLDVWKFVKNRDIILKILKEKINKEALRIYLLTFSPS